MAFGSEQHAASLARPGGNVTGVAYSAEGTLLPKRFELLKEMVPTAKRIGMLDDGSPRFRVLLSEAQPAARSLDVQLVTVDARRGRYETAFASMKAQRIDAVYGGSSPIHGITLVGIVVASPERARQYFRHFPPCFPIGAAPDCAIHRAYGLPEVVRPADSHQIVESEVSELLRASGVPFEPGQALDVFAKSDGFEMTSADDAEWRRPLQKTGDFLIGCDSVIRWARFDIILTVFPKVADLISLL